MKPIWTTQFKIDDATWNSLSHEAAQHLKSPLGIAFERGLINENHFIAWERERTGIVSLKSVFFNGNPPRDLWMLSDFKLCQQGFCMPVGKWEDHVYWAKLSGDQVGMESQLKDVIWVLAPWSSLKKWFSIWQGEVSVVSTPSQGAASFGGFQAADEPMPDPQNPEESKGEEGEEAKPIEESQATFNGPPQGIAAIPTEKTLSGIDFGAIKPLTDKPGAPEHQEVVERPPIIDTNAQIITSSVLKPMPSALSKEMPSLSPPIFNLDTNASISVTSGTQVDFELPPVQSTGLKPMPAMSASPNRPPPPISSAEVAAIPLESITDKLKNARSQEDLAHAILGGWQNYFDRVMILLVQGGNLIIWRWWGQWNGNFQRGEPVNLDTPSIFKITFTTGHPYHGHVTPGPINEQFFKLTNGGFYPDHVTVAPVTAEGQCLAMIVGGSSKEGGKKIVLNKLEDQTKLFAIGLLKFLTPIPKAG